MPRNGRRLFMALFDKKTLVQSLYKAYMVAVYTLGVFLVGHLHGLQRDNDIYNELNAVIESQARLINSQENVISLQESYIDCLKDLHLICQQNLTSCEENQTDFSSEP